MGYPECALLGQGSADEGVAQILSLGVSDGEDDVIAGLEGGDHGAVALLVGDGVTVDLNDDDVVGKVDLVREGAWTDAGDREAALDAEVGGDSRGDRLNRDAQLVLPDVTGVGTAGCRGGTRLRSGSAR